MIGGKLPPPSLLKRKIIIKNKKKHHHHHHNHNKKELAPEVTEDSSIPASIQGNGDISSGHHAHQVLLFTCLIIFMYVKSMCSLFSFL